MRVTRLLCRLCSLLALCIAAVAAMPAQADYPDHAIKLIVPVPPGGGVDLLSRAIGAKMSRSMGQPGVIENKAGASAAIGTEALAKSPADVAPDRRGWYRPGARSPARHVPSMLAPSSSVVAQAWWPAVPAAIGRWD